ncbi:Altered inheritance of mitochondria protein, mitochondrial, partial [Lachnellula subtilissima]
MLSRQTIRASRLCCVRSYATGATSAPPMLLKIRADLKTAMRAKDANRLAVLRALLSQTLNASKTNTPINTDMQMLALLRKTSAQSRAASDEFTKNGREDLAAKEQDQIRVLEEYAGNVEVVGEEEVRRAVGGGCGCVEGG